MSLRPAHLLKLGLYMVLVGILVWWIFALAMPVARRWEFPESEINSLPAYGFVIGAALGLGMTLVSGIREVVFIVLGCVVLGAFLWFFTLVLVRGVLLVVEVPEDAVDAISEWVGPIAFAMGPVLGLSALFAFGHDRFFALRARLKSRQGKVPRTR